MPSTSTEEIVRIESEENLDEAYQAYKQLEPIIFKGIGRLTMFGLTSRFDSQFPSRLTGKLAPEELKETMHRINDTLEKNMGTNIRWFACGLLFCCCSCGISLWPVICLNRRTVTALEKMLELENQQLYNKLNLNWRLCRCPVEESNLTEYVLLLEFVPKIPLSVPD